LVPAKLDVFHTQANVSILPANDRKLELQAGVTISIQSDIKQSIRAGTKVDTPEKYLLALEIRLYSEAIAGCFMTSFGERFVSLSNFLQYLWKLRNVSLTYSKLAPHELLHLLRTKDELIRTRWANALNKGFPKGVTYNEAILASEEFIEIIMADTTGCPMMSTYKEVGYANRTEHRYPPAQQRAKVTRAPKTHAKGSYPAAAPKGAGGDTATKGKKAAKGNKGKGSEYIKLSNELNGKRNCIFYNTSGCRRDTCSFGHVCDVLMPAPKNAQCGGNHPRIEHRGATQPA
jgi:hypothetical protein